MLTYTKYKSSEQGRTAEKIRKRDNPGEVPAGVAVEWVWLRLICAPLSWEIRLPDVEVVAPSWPLSAGGWVVVVDAAAAPPPCSVARVA